MSFENSDAVATELIQFTENESDLYQKHTLPILTNLATKKASGEYSSDRAIRAFMYLADAGAKKFVREFETNGTPWNVVFPISVRRAAATHWRDEFDVEFEQGNYDSLLPKKYQKKPDTRSAAEKKYHAYKVGDEVAWWGSQGTEVFGTVAKVILGPERPFYRIKTRSSGAEVLKPEFELVSKTARKKFARQTKAADRRKHRNA
jgi:hypothetical protein